MNMQAAQLKTIEPAKADNSNAKGTVLCVDDEKQILSSLKRVFRRGGYNVLLANGGKEALEVLNNEQVDLVISDMRMPEMTGAELLSEAAEQWPDTVRILLTGYADLESSITAINEGRIYRYVSKPWDDQDLMMTVHTAIEQKQLKDKHRILELVTKKQNKQLKELTESLDAKVKAKTASLQKGAILLKNSYAKLQKSYHDAIPVFASVIDLREGISAGHGRLVADMAKAIAEEMKLDAKQCESIYFSGLLHQIGKIGMSDELFTTPYNALTPEQREEYDKYPVTGQMVLMSLQPLADTGKIIYAHKERWDGKGFPEGLQGEDILVGARILAVASEFYDFQSGSLNGETADRDEARTFITNNSSTRYDPAVVNAFKSVFETEHGASRVIKELKLGVDDLQDNMELTKDVTFQKGILLMRKGQVLTSDLIEKMKNIQEELDDQAIHVKPQSEDTSDV